jgi:hypothetical protein
MNVPEGAPDTDHSSQWMTGSDEARGSVQSAA